MFYKTEGKATFSLNKQNELHANIKLQCTPKVVTIKHEKDKQCPRVNELLTLSPLLS